MTHVLTKDINLKDYDIEHIGEVVTKYENVWEMIVPLGKDYTATLRIDDEAINNSGYFYDKDGIVSSAPFVPVENFDKTAFYLSSEMRNNTNHTLGSILTVLEAVVTNENQLEALKSLVRKELYLMTDRNQSVIYERANMQKSGLSPKKYLEFKDSNGKYESHSIQ